MDWNQCEYSKFYKVDRNLKLIEVSVNIRNFKKYIGIGVNIRNFTKWIDISRIICILRIEISLTIRNTV